MRSTVSSKIPYSWDLSSCAPDLISRQSSAAFSLTFSGQAIFGSHPGLRMASPWPVPRHITWKHELKCIFSTFPCFCLWAPRTIFPLHSRRGLRENRAEAPGRVPAWLARLRVQTCLGKEGGRQKAVWKGLGVPKAPATKTECGEGTHGGVIDTQKPQLPDN